MSEARPSSAVILVRTRGGGAEVFLGRRHSRATFASTFVFPGGVLTAEDGRVHGACGGLDAAEADRRLSLEAGGLDYYSAAIRELFEETGVLLATDLQGEPLAEAGFAALARARGPLAAGDRVWPDILAGWDGRLAAGCLHYVGHWETPVALKARFDTRFFVAELPPGQEPVHDGEELVDSRWLAPAEAVSLHGAGELDLPFPHLKHLETLAGFATPEALLDWARNRWREGVVKVRPWLSQENGVRRLLLPGEPGYGDHPGESA